MGEHLLRIYLDIRRQALLSVIRILSSFVKGLSLASELHQISQVSSFMSF